MKNNKLLLQMHGIGKSFGGITALEEIDLDLKYNEVHALVGENGAGKSTLSKIIAGVYLPNSGRMILENSVYSPRDRFSGANRGVYIIYQESSLVPSLSVAENMFLGKLHEFTKNGCLNWKIIYERTAEILEAMRLKLSPKSSISDLSLGVRKLIEFAKASYFNPKILIIDEATAFLNSEETELLFEKIRSLRNEERSIIYISHHLEEIFKICSEITVLKDGRLVKTLPIDMATKQDISSLMVGRNINSDYFRNKSDKGKYPDKLVLSVAGLSSKDKYRNISFDLHEGEILGIGGLVGSGKEEVAETLFGERRAEAGSITINGRIRENYSIPEAIDLGIAYIPRERDDEGLILITSIRENICLPILKRMKKYNLIQNSKCKETARKYFQFLKIKANGLESLCNSLSGGNRQKVVLAKWLGTDPMLLIMNNPTRGIDVGVKVEVYELIRDLVRKNVAILLVSDELPELIGLCDRLIIMRKREISKIFDNANDNVREKDIIKHML